MSALKNYSSRQVKVRNGSEQIKRNVLEINEKFAARVVERRSGLIVYDRSYLDQFSNSGPPARPSKWKCLKFRTVFSRKDLNGSRINLSTLCFGFLCICKDVCEYVDLYSI